MDQECSSNSEDSYHTPSSLRDRCDSKSEKIDRWLKEKDDNVAMIRTFCLSRGGLCTDSNRRQLWPRLLCIDDKTPTSDITAITTPHGWHDELKLHSEWSQVERDVHRTLARFPPGISDQERYQLQDSLTPIVVRLLADNRQFRYYQGFHDVCLTFLLVFPEQPMIAYECIRNLIENEEALFRIFLLTPLELAVPKLGKLVYVILYETDSELELYIRRAEIGTMFCLSWLLTWFSHSIEDSEKIARIYDFFLASHSLMPIYFAASLILYRSSDLVEACGVRPDMPQVHSFLSKIPDDLPWEALISDAQDLFLQFPPKKLKNELLSGYNKKVAVHEQRLKSTGRGWRAILPRRETLLNTAIWAMAAGTAAWYLYSRYGVREMSWMQVF